MMNPRSADSASLISASTCLLWLITFRVCSTRLSDSLICCSVQPKITVMVSSMPSPISDHKNERFSIGSALVRRMADKGGLEFIQSPEMHWQKLGQIIHLVRLS